MANANDSGAVCGTYAEALPIPSEILRPFLKLVERWVSCSGTQWTVARLKGVYVDFIRHSAGEPMVATWIRRSPKDGLPSGVVGGLFRFATKGKRQSYAVITLLRAYTQFVATEPLDPQMEKFLAGVSAEDVEVPQGIIDGLVASVKELGLMARVGLPSPYWTYAPSDNKRVPCLDGRTRPEAEYWMYQWHDLHLSYYGQTAMRRWSDIFRGVLGSWEPYYNSVGPHSRRIDSVGAIGLIQEPGLKLRAVANPNRVYQKALEPMGNALFSLLRELPWDCTHDQGKAIPPVQNHLSAGKVVHCVDLSSATDYFPLKLQLPVLRAVLRDGGLDYTGLFEFLSRAPWRMGDSVLRWNKGQPLGLYPSFASFALTHGLLLFYLNKGFHNGEFFVLGDDVVILNDRLFIEYVKTLKELGCPTSEAKSLNSSRMAEFAGKLVTRTAVFPQPKWRQMSDDNFLDVIRLLGGRALRLCRPRQRRVAKVLWELPEFLGGLGFNPHGKPLEDRCYDALVTLGQNDTGVYLMSLDERVNRFFHPERPVNGILPRPVWKGDNRIRDLDQRSLALTLKHLPQLAEWFGQPLPGEPRRLDGGQPPFVVALNKVLGSNLHRLFPQGDLLPEAGGLARQSTLAVLERKLKLT